MTKPPPPPTPPTDHNLVYFILSAMIAATIGGFVLHYLKHYDPLGKAPGVEANT